MLKAKLNQLDHEIDDFQKPQPPAVVLIVLCGIFTLCQLFGFIGPWYESFCLTFVYLIIQMIITITDIIQVAFYGTALWYTAIWSFVVSFLTLIFLRDLYLINQNSTLHPNQQQQNNHNYCSTNNI